MPRHRPVIGPLQAFSQSESHPSKFTAVVSTSTPTTFISSIPTRSDFTGGRYRVVEGRDCLLERLLVFWRDVLHQTEAVGRKGFLRLVEIDAFHDLGDGGGTGGRVCAIHGAVGERKIGRKPLGPTPTSRRRRAR